MRWVSIPELPLQFRHSLHELPSPLIGGKALAGFLQRLDHSRVSPLCGALEVRRAARLGMRNGPTIVPLELAT